MNTAPGAAGPLPDTELPVATPCPGARDDDLTVALCSEPSSVRIARDLTAATLRRWHLSKLCDSVVIVVSELVTNALVHGAPLVEGAGGAPDKASRWLIFLRLVRGTSGLMCLVADPSDREPIRLSSGDLPESGHGLQIVAGNSRRWGWARCRTGGKVVWALFGKPGSDAQIHPR